jgi:hypothetical protein
MLFMGWFKPEKIKKIGIWAFVFFLIKGLIWLALVICAYLSVS